MNPRFALKFIAFVVLAVATSATTWLISSRSRAARAATADVVVTKPTGSVKVVKVDKLPEPGPRSPETIADGGMDELTVTVVGQRIHVFSRIHLFDRLPDRSYLWSIRVTDSYRREKPVFQNYYQDQVFKPPLGEDASYTFDDTLNLNLPAGKYLVDLLAYEVRPHFGVAEILNEPLRARGFVGMQGQRVVKVGP